MRRLWVKILLVGLVLLAALILALYLPPPSLPPPPNFKPANTYAEAEARITTLQAEDNTLALYPGCSVQFMTHGHKVERAIVLLHGYRSCPKEWHELGTKLYNLGYNVLIPRMPYHGLADVMTTSQAQLSPEVLVPYASELVDIAHGLGDHITIAGMSAGAVLAGWVAQNRGDINQVVIVSPAFGLQAVPAVLTTPATNLFLFLPNFFLQDSAPNPKQVYPQNSTRAIAEIILRMSFAIRTAAHQSRPAVPSIIVVTNANDDTVDNRVTDEIVESWRNSGVADLETYQFKADLQLPHPLLDREQPGQNVDVVHPILIDLMSK